MIYAPGTYTALAMSEYLALPAMSAGTIKTSCDDCMARAWWESAFNPARAPDDTNASDAGTIAHSILLDGHPGRVCVIDPQEHPAEKTGAIPAGWTNKSIRAARDGARSAGLIPVLKDDMASIEAMVASARTFIASLKTTEPYIYATMQEGGGDSEVSYLWEEDGLLCRMRPDRIAKDCGLVVHVKTTEMSVLQWANQFDRSSQYVTSSWYRRGINTLFSTQSEHIYMVIEQKAPYLCGLVGTDPHAFALGDEKVTWGLKQWKACAASGSWPGYSNRVMYPEIKPWVDAAWADRQAEYGL